MQGECFIVVSIQSRKIGTMTKGQLMKNLCNSAKIFLLMKKPAKLQEEQSLETDF
jgi:hypothetical protein